MDERHPANGTVAPVIRTGDAPGRRNLRPPWKPGQSGNPKGRVPYRRHFEEVLARAVTENAEALVSKLITMALDGDAGMMRVLVERLVRRAEHALDDGEHAQATRLEVVFVNPEGTPCEGCGHASGVPRAAIS